MVIDLSNCYPSNSSKTFLYVMLVVLITIKEMTKTQIKKPLNNCCLRVFFGSETEI